MSAAPLLEIHQLHKSYGRRTVLHDVSLQLDAGKVMCVIGPSGSGKSTLLKCINHLERVDGGFIRVGEELIGYSYHHGRLHEMHETDICRQRANIGMVFQQFNLFAHMTVLENIVAAPIRVRNIPRAGAAAGGICSRMSACSRKLVRILRNFPGASNSAWASPGHSRWIRADAVR